MSAQCLVVPVLFYILASTVSPEQNIVGVGQAFIICSLPLSTLWASADAGTSTSITTLTPNVHSTTTSNVTVDSQGRSKFPKFWRFKRSTDSHSSYSEDLEKTSSYSPTGVQVHTTLQVQSFDKPLDKPQW